MLPQEKIMMKLKPALRIVKIHPLKNWFNGRGVTSKQLADLTKVLPTKLTRYMNGIEPFPDKVLTQLESFKEIISAWERETGRNWRTRYNED